MKKTVRQKITQQLKVFEIAQLLFVQEWAGKLVNQLEELEEIFSDSNIRSEIKDLLLYADRHVAHIDVPMTLCRVENLGDFSPNTYVKACQLTSKDSAGKLLARCGKEELISIIKAVSATDGWGVDLDELQDSIVWFGQTNCWVTLDGDNIVLMQRSPGSSEDTELARF